MILSLAKSYDFFKPEECQGRIHIIGCGSVGSTLAELLARYGLTKITLYDFDVVEPHNLANQMFTQKHVGMSKVDALVDILTDINPEIKNNLKIENQGYVDQILSGYVFLCVDNIDLRREIATNNKYNVNIKAMFDFRTGLTDAQHYAADWSSRIMINNFLDTMQFSHEEAMAETPVSACNVTLSVAPTVRMVCALGVANFTNFVKGGELKKTILINAFNFMLDAWDAK